MAKIYGIAKNTSFFTLALILQKIISFSYFAILARNLLPEDLGKYYFAISFTTIFAIFIDIGLANVLTREVAKDKNRADKLLSSVLIIKIPLSILVFLTMFLFLFFLDYPDLTRKLVYISAISMILDSFTITFYAVIRGFHTLKYESIGVVLFQVIVLGFGLYVLEAGLGLIWLIFALALASIFSFGYSSILAFRKLKIKFIAKVDKPLIKTLLAITLPFGAYAVFQRLYMYLDTVLLYILAGDKYVGLYQISFKIIFALQFLPMAFVASLYPAFASYWKNNKTQLPVSFERAINYLIIISLPISGGIIILADKIIGIFKPEYFEATLPLQLIICSIVFIFINFPIGSLLNACDRQKINTINMALTLAASVILNILLIPRYQALGASITVLFTNILMFMLGIFQVPKIINLPYIKIAKVFSKSLAGTLLMVLAVANLQDRLNLFLLVFLGGLIYFIILYILKAIKKEDIASIFKAFNRN